MDGGMLASGSGTSLAKRERERTHKDSLPEGLNEALGDFEQEDTELPLMCWSGLPSPPREINRAAFPAPSPIWAVCSLDIYNVKVSPICFVFLLSQYLYVFCERGTVVIAVPI